MNFITQHLDTMIIAAVAIILGFDRLKSGTSVLRKEIAADYKERNIQLDDQIIVFKDQIKELQDKHRENELEIARMQATMVEKDKRIQELTLLNNDKNPDVLNLLKQITNSNTSIHEFMKIIHKVLIDSKSELHFQTALLEKGDQRNDGIDKASAKGEGDAMLTPEK